MTALPTWLLPAVTHFPKELPLALLDATLKATLLLIAAAVVARLLRRAPAAARHVVWAAACAVMISFPMLSLLGPGWRWAVLPAAGVSAGEAMQEGKSPSVGLPFSSAGVEIRSANPNPLKDATSWPTFVQGSQLPAESPTSTSPKPMRVVSGAASGAGAGARPGASPAIQDIFVQRWSIGELPAALTLAWLGGVAVMLALWLFGLISVARVSRRSKPANEQMNEELQSAAS